MAFPTDYTPLDTDIDDATATDNVDGGKDHPTAHNEIHAALNDLATQATTNEPYDATDWNGSLEFPTKDAVRDAIETASSFGTYVRRVVQTLTDKTSFATTDPEQWGTEEAVLDNALLPVATGVTVHAHVSGSVEDGSAAFNVSGFVEISVDGGSTWSAGLYSRINDASGGGATDRYPYSAAHTVTGGTVTGDIMARVMLDAASTSASWNFLQGALHMEVIVPLA